MKDLNPKHYSNQEIALAIEKLKSFMGLDEQNSSTKQHDLKNSFLLTKIHFSFSDTIDLAKYFISSIFSEKARHLLNVKKSQLQKEVSKAIDTLKSHYLLIQKFKKGSPAEQQLAIAAISAIQNYNEMMSLQKKKKTSWSQRAISFLYHKSGLSIDKSFFDQKINLPISALEYSEAKKFSLMTDSPLTLTNSQKISSFLPFDFNKDISIREADAFRVKAISLLKAHSNRFLSVSDQLNSVKITPIQTLPTDSSTIISMSQTLNPLPGEKIVLKGLFRREEENTSTPIPESFELSSAAEQNGYPYPSQHTGWALSDVLIPYCPLEFDELPLFYRLYEEKAYIAKELLPKGRFNLKAKELLKAKKEFFEQNSVDLLEQHKKFNLALLKIAPHSVQLENPNEKIHLFFENVSTFDLFSKTNEVIVTEFITRPYQILQDFWFEYRHPGLLCTQPKKRFQEALAILQAASDEASRNLKSKNDQSELLLERSITDYIICMGSLLAPACHKIILQHLSEIMGFSPPMLDDYEIRIQALAYKQLIEFHQQIHSSKANEDIFEFFTNQLTSDFHIVNLPSYEKLPDSFLILINELEVYYNSKFYLSLNNKNQKTTN